MTRTARSGSTQRHQKQPEDATPWEEFSKTPKKTKGKRKSIPVASDGEQFSDDNAAESSAADVSPTIKSSSKRGHEDDAMNSKKRKKSKTPRKHSPKSIETTELLSSGGDDDPPGSDSELGLNDSSGSVSKDFGDEQPKAMTKGRKIFMERVKKNRAKSGILLLPQPVEDNLYKIKKKLRDQGVPDVMVQAVARKERRKAELEFRKNDKVCCYGCRKFGHVVAKCPQLKNGDPEQGTGICFKCGSTEHISRDCRDKSENFPFAKCYICHKQGHLSRACPRNSHGIYPKGGKCNLCGEIDHLKKDCPKLRKKKVEEEEVTVGTLTEVKSVDEEMIQRSVKSLPAKKKKKAKIIKF